MPSQLLFVTSCLRASYKPAQNILYLDWQGSLTLSAVQVASAQVAQHVRAVGYDVATWLGPSVLPGLCLLGASQVAWVYQDSLEGAALARSFSAGLTLPTCLFTNTASAVAWLTTQPSEQPPRPAAETSRLQRVVRVFQWKVLVQLARHPLWLLVEAGVGASRPEAAYA